MDPTKLYKYVMMTKEMTTVGLRILTIIQPWRHHFISKGWDRSLDVITSKKSKKSIIKRQQMEIANVANGNWPKLIWFDHGWVYSWTSHVRRLWVRVWQSLHLRRQLLSQCRSVWPTLRVGNNSRKGKETSCVYFIFFKKNKILLCDNVLIIWRKYKIL